jgi:hypothetical protein
MDNTNVSAKAGQDHRSFVALLFAAGDLRRYALTGDQLWKFHS